MPFRLFAGLLMAFVVSFLVLASVPAAEPTRAKVDYNRDVRPILSKNCFPCHGPDAGTRAGKMRLDVRELALRKPRRAAAPLVPGHPEDSDVIQRLTSEDAAVRMPPEETGNRLTPEQVDILRRWIREGATYAEHWAFLRPSGLPLPAVRDVQWPRHGLDHFVLARLEGAGLKPSQEADRATLVRRVSLDLRGLPPTPAEVEAFLNDTAPQAYERLVDRFLDDPAYGERWARMWLDLARYADSAGYGSDPLRPNIWRYRDWVIDAFNRNLPYDQFTLEQLAGDLLPGATVEQKVATAFHRNTMTNTEGGTDDEEFRVAAVKDRVDTTLQVWMGLTFGCAKCHSHKYDPITQKEYYSFFDIFNQTSDTDQPDERPTLPAPTARERTEIERIEARVGALRRQLDEETPELKSAQERWETSLKGTAEWSPLRPLQTRSEGGATVTVLPDHSVLASGAHPKTDVTVVTARTERPGVVAFRLEAIPDPSLPSGGAGRGTEGEFVLSRISVQAAPVGVTQGPKAKFVRLELPGENRILSLAEVQVFREGKNVALTGQARQSSTDYGGEARRAIDGKTDGEYYRGNSVTHTAAEANPWWEVELSETGPVEKLMVWNRTDGGVGTRLAGVRILLLDEARQPVWQQTLAEPPGPSREWTTSGIQSVALTHVFATHGRKEWNPQGLLESKPTKEAGWGGDSKHKGTQSLVFGIATPSGVSGPVEWTLRLEQKSPKGGAALARFRLSVTEDRALAQRAALPDLVRAALEMPTTQRTADQRATIARHYRSVAPALQAIREEIARLEKSRPMPVTVPVMAELPGTQRRSTHLMNKGNFLDKGEKVRAALPAAFVLSPPGETQQVPLDRLGVARWLMAPGNPLTSRVAVNRLWAQLWGTGIVSTEEDFGTQGELPSHPELLDWLAKEYLRQQWNTKALLKILVTSATYRQSSRVTPELLAQDPNNRLFSRGPRFRLDAEMVRDQALALSGLLSRKVGGPSVYPPQPPGLWQAAFNGQRTYPTSTGEDRYRRGIYTFWRRTIPYPSMAAFDAPSRETCTVRRIRTNTPLQAFITLNDPVYVECAQALARRLVAQGGQNATDRARFGLTLCLARSPREEQVQAVVSLFEKERDTYRKDVKAALSMATDPLGPVPGTMDPAELAAWTVVANVLLNMDGVLTKG